MKDVEFKIESPFEPSGDQPQAIKELCEGVERGERNQVLLGVTGSGKTFTMAKIIEQCQRPALIMEPNKILAAQLYAEMKEFFPHNRVEYFVSYYDYYQPEAYIPKTDTTGRQTQNLVLLVPSTGLEYKSLHLLLYTYLSSCPKTKMIGTVNHR